LERARLAVLEAERQRQTEEIARRGEVDRQAAAMHAHMEETVRETLKQHLDQERVRAQEELRVTF